MGCYVSASSPAQPAALATAASTYHDRWNASHSRLPTTEPRPRRATALRCSCWTAWCCYWTATIEPSIAAIAPVHPSSTCQPPGWELERSSTLWAAVGPQRLQENHQVRQCHRRATQSITYGLLVWSAWRPNGLLQRMKELETEAILFAGPLNHLAWTEHHCAHPVAALCLLALVDEQQAGLQHTPQLRPGLKCAAHLQKNRRHFVSRAWLGVCLSN